MSESSNEKIRLLVSANDPGSAFQLCEVLKCAKGTPGVEVCVVAGAATQPIFEQVGISAIRSCSARVEQPAENDVQENLSEAAAIIADFLPDAILVGLSGPDCGIDEGLVACAGDRPTYAVQDFWGDVNHGFGCLPNTYFVLDEFAAQITRQRAPSSRVIITGSPRHAATQQPDYLILRKRFRDGMDAKKSDRCVVFFGQPLWHLPGYALTILTLSEALASYADDLIVCYRPHPKESGDECRKALDFLGASGARVKLDNSRYLEVSLCGADLMLSCYSSCGLDLTHISRFSPLPLGVMIFAMFQKDVRQFYRSTTSLDGHPLVEQGLVSIIEERSDIQDIILSSWSEKSRFQKWKAARKHARASIGAAECILSTIVHDVARKIN